jgi:hypothetical protein
VQQTGIVVDVHALHDVARQLRRTTTALHELGLRAGSLGVWPDVPNPLRDRWDALLDSVRRALAAEVEAVGRVAAAVDAAAGDYETQDVRVAAAATG